MKISTCEKDSLGYPFPFVFFSFWEFRNGRHDSLESQACMNNVTQGVTLVVSSRTSAMRVAQQFTAQQEV